MNRGAHVAVCGLSASRTAKSPFLAPCSTPPRHALHGHPGAHFGRGASRTMFSTSGGDVFAVGERHRVPALPACCAHPLLYRYSAGPSGSRPLRPLSVCARQWHPLSGTAPDPLVVSARETCLTKGRVLFLRGYHPEYGSIAGFAFPSFLRRGQGRLTQLLH